MRTKLFAAAALLAALAGAGWAVSERVSTPAPPAARLASAPGRPTPADALIRKAEAIVKAFPERPDGYNQLAAAYMKKARETGSFDFNARAAAALERSLAIAPENFDALGIRAALLLARHEFCEAVAVARSAQRIRDDSPDVYGTLSDALLELGDYAGAVEAAQMMMDLRPDAAAYARASYLRVLHGQTDGAIDTMATALRAANPNDVESVAWFRVHLGDELMSAGMTKEAEAEYDGALAAFPDYHLALAAKARARALAGDYEAAFGLFARAHERVPLADTAISLGDLAAKLGRADEAKRRFDAAEAIERAGGGVSSSRQLALCWAHPAVRRDHALAAARREREARSDVYTADLLAWCLFKKGDFAGARDAMAEALRLGTRDARLLYHAGMIYEALGDRQSAVAALEGALRARVSFDNGTSSFGVTQADTAREALARLRSVAA
jgi:tetratricopeptide (TPR) repeat protein